MDFLTSTILSGLAWDGIKTAGKVTVGFMKEKLRDWLISDSDLETIIQIINDFPEAYKKNVKFIECAIEEEEKLIKILEGVKPKQETHIDMRETRFENSTVNSAGSGSTFTTTHYYYQQPKSESTSKTRQQLREELKVILDENAIVYKMYGPTDENKSDLTSRKHEAWRSMAKEIIVPNNEKIVKLLQDNQVLLTTDEQMIFIQFKIHAQGFKDNQNRNERISEYPQFPLKINDILGGI